MGLTVLNFIERMIVSANHTVQKGGLSYVHTTDIQQLFLQDISVRIISGHLFEL